MRVQVGTVYVDSVELVSARLAVHLADGREVVLLNDVQDFSAVRWGDKTHIVAWDQRGEGWHFHGQDTFASGKLELDHAYGGGSLLVADDGGQVHLIYLTQPVKGQGAALRHQVFAEAWSKSMLITTHVRPDKWGFSACWEQGFLHLAYLSHGDGHLFYRVYNAAHKTWSGAVPVVQKPCHHPQFFPGRELVLAWIGEEMAGGVQLMRKREHWSKTQTVSHPGGVCSGLGCSFLNEELYLLWRQGEKLWKLAVLAEGAEPVEEESSQYALGLQVVAASDGAALTVPVYGRQAAKEKEAGPSPREAVKPAEEPRDAAEAELEAALIEQAFKIQMEWEKLRVEYQDVRRQMVELEEEVRAELRALAQGISNLPRPKLEPLMQRVERLEIRLTKYERDLREGQMQLENRLAKLEQASLAVSRRLGALENPEPKPSFWQRLWRM